MAKCPFLQVFCLYCRHCWRHLLLRSLKFIFYCYPIILGCLQAAVLHTQPIHAAKLGGRIKKWYRLPQPARQIARLHHSSGLQVWRKNIITALRIAHGTEEWPFTTLRIAHGTEKQLTIAVGVPNCCTDGQNFALRPLRATVVLLFISADI